MTTRIEADRLIPGRGEPTDNGVLIIDGSEITYAGPASEAPETPDADVIKTPAVMPGMWECHGHFLGTLTAYIDEAFVSRPQMTSMRTTADARAVLDAGFTSVREMGGHGVFLGRVIDEGRVVGPNVYGSGSMLSMTAGHGDMHGVDIGSARHLQSRAWGEDNIVDGPDECRAGVRRMLRMGAKVIKIHASGGVMSEIDDPHLPQFSKEELEAIVDEATRMERLVGAHCHGKRGIMAALEAGIMTIEHGSFLDEEAAEAMVETGAILVPTRWIIEFLLEEGERRGMPEYAAVKLRAVADTHAEGMRIAIDKGVRIALGTDMWATGLWGRNAEEMGLMVDLGMSNLHAIEMATANAPATLGPQAPNAGLLKAGMDADVICVSGDPSQDVKVLEDTANVTHVFKGGIRYKG